MKLSSLSFTEIVVVSITLVALSVRASAPNPDQLYSKQVLAYAQQSQKDHSSPALAHTRHPVVEGTTHAHSHRRTGSDRSKHSRIARAARQANAVRTPSATQAQVPRAPTSTRIFKGASSYYLFSLGDDARRSVLDAIASGGFTVVRVFVASVLANNKGSGNAHVNDLEPNQLGVYDDSILVKIDQLMLECSSRGLKLLIVLGDRYALGFWSTDVYATTLGIAKQGSSGAQMISDASLFYKTASAITAYDNRISHILSHTNALMGGGSKWSDLSSVIYGFEAQNEPQGHMNLVAPNWVCDRSAHIKSLLPSSSTIKVSSGGGIDIQTSLAPGFTSCASLDIISVHDYGTNAAATVSYLNTARSQFPSKQIILGEFGATGPNKASILASFTNALNNAGFSWMVWEIVNPGKGAADFEIWTDEPSWKAITSGSAPVVTPSSTTSHSTTTVSKTTSSAPTLTPKSATPTPRSRTSSRSSSTTTSSKSQ